MWVEDVLYGAVSQGVNAPTLILLNGALLFLVALLLGTLVLFFGPQPWLALHLALLLVLALVVAALINWLVLQTGGTVPAERQRKELLGYGGQAPDDEHAAPSPGAGGVARSKAE